MQLLHTRFALNLQFYGHTRCNAIQMIAIQRNFKSIKSSYFEMLKLLFVEHKHQQQKKKTNQYKGKKKIYQDINVSRLCSEMH